MGTPSTALRDWPDRDLVVAFKSGRPGAYEEMYRRYGARVEGVCRRMLGNVEDANEATQETFLKAYQALPRFNGNYKLGAWLHRIAANVCLDVLRARARGVYLVSLPDGQESLDADPGPEELVAAGGEANAALEKIQPLHARALRLRAVEGMSHKEMARALEMTPQQVKALLHRARDSFKRAWESASGWVLAPLLGFRSFLEDKQLHATSAPMGSVSAVGAPLLAEKVAASAIVVAAAIAGVASPSSVAATPTEARVSVAAPVDPALSSVAVIDEADTSTAVQVPAPTKVAEELIEAVKETVEEEPKSKESKSKNDDEGGEFDPDQASTELTRAVEKAVEELPVP